MGTLIKKNFDAADDSARPVEKISIDTIQVDGRKLQRVSAQPGWRWSQDLKPLFNTDSCQVDHLLYMLSGRMGVRMDSGEETEYAAGDTAAIPPGHDGWTVGDQPAVWLEIPH